jgi:uncharacterized OB-fold protein
VIVPLETDLTRPYWAAAGRGQVLLQRCDRCAIVWHPPTPVCPRCRGTDWRWEPASGAAELVSWTRIAHAAHTQVSDVLPYLVALVRLAEGPLFLCGLVDPGDSGTALVDAAPLTIELGPAAGGMRLPMARCVRPGARVAASPAPPG